MNSENYEADEKEIEDGMKEVFADAEEDAGKAAEQEICIEPVEEETEELEPWPARKQRNLGIFGKITVFLRTLAGFLKTIWRCLSSIPKKLKNLKYTLHRFYVNE